MPIFEAYGDPIVTYNTTATTLTNSMAELDYNEPDLIMHESVITGKRTVVVKGTRFKAKISLRGMSYSIYSTVKSWLGKTVTLQPYGSGNVVIGATTYTAPSITCLVTKVKFYHLDNLLFKDACLLEMESESYYELALSVVGS
jgi:hypothetical protein